MTEGWRWVHGLMAIWSGAMFIATILLVPETYPPVLLRKRAQRLSQLSGKVYRSRGDIDQGKITLGEAFSTGLKRPWVLLFMEPIVLLLSLYHAIIYGILYMLFGAFPIVFRGGRHWNEGISGLPFIAVALGIFLALVYVSVVDHKQYMKKVKDSGVGYTTPEARLPMCIVGGIALPIGLFWFAWTNSPSIPWPVCVIASIPFGFGMVLIFLSIMNYLIDSYTIFAASVLAGNGVIRSVFGAAFPLFTKQMYDSLGIHWASSIPAFLAVACIPLPFLFYKYGFQIRSKCKYAAQSEAFMQRMRARAAGTTEEQPAGAETADTSRSATIAPESEAAEEDAHERENESRFAELKTEKEAEGGALKKTHTNRSTRSRRSVRDDYYDNPFDIDRVNTRESFTTRPRSTSHASSHHRK